MERFFNTAGPVRADLHYCIDPLSRIDLPDVLRLIQQQKYFVLHAPRQTGKTSSLLALRQRLNGAGTHRCVYINVESAQSAREDVDQAMRAVVWEFGRALRNLDADRELIELCTRLHQAHSAINALSEVCAAWAAASDKPSVLLVDEIDSLVGDSLVSVLRQIRAGYSQRPDHFPQSIILCGVRDVRDYRLRINGSEMITGGSAFNIKAKSLRLGEFERHEVELLLGEHTRATGQTFHASAVELVRHLTCGQPWLVNALAQEVCFEMPEGLDRTRPVTVEMVDKARENIVIRRDTHIDQLIDKLREQRVRRVIEPMLAGEDVETTLPTDDRQYVEDLGLVKRSDRGLVIANPIYEEVVPRELTWIMQESIQSLVPDHWYVDPESKRLLMDKLLVAFQDFFRENADTWLEKFDYKEAGPHLLLQAFLQRIINGGGTLVREYGLGRRRTDLLVKWPLPDNTVQKEVLELKLARKSLELTIKDGLQQTAQYMDTAGVAVGHLLIFDRSSGKSWEEKIFVREEIVGGKQIRILGM